MDKGEGDHCKIHRIEVENEIVKQATAEGDEHRQSEHRFCQGGALEYGNKGHHTVEAVGKRADDAGGGKELKEGVMRHRGHGPHMGKGARLKLVHRLEAREAAAEDRIVKEVAPRDRPELVAAVGVKAASEIVIKHNAQPRPDQNDAADDGKYADGADDTIWLLIFAEEASDDNRGGVG